jgi:hypothetical protein
VKYHTVAIFEVFTAVFALQIVAKSPYKIIIYIGIQRQAEVALGVPGRLRSRIFSTFGTTRVVGRQPNAPAAFIPGEMIGTHFQRLSRPQGTWFCRKEPQKKSQVIPPGIDPETVRLVAQRLNHYATPGPLYIYIYIHICVCVYIPYILESNPRYFLPIS